MGAEESIDDNLKHFNVDDHKPCIDDDVHDTRYRSCRHFTLAQGDPGHGLPSLCFSIASIPINSGKDVPANDRYSLGEKEAGGAEDGKKKQLAQHRLVLSVVVFRVVGFPRAHPIVVR